MTIVESALVDAIPLVVSMNYPGKVISVNHCYTHTGGRVYLRGEARRWRDTLADGIGWTLYEAGLRGVALARPILVRIDASYTDEAHATDPTNLRKLVDDAVEAALGVNDRHVQPERGTTCYGAAIPMIVVTVFVRREEG